VTIARRFAEDQRPAAALLFWQAFGSKLGRLMRPDDRALQFLENVIDPGYAISATAPDGKLLGIAGFKSADSAFVGGSLRDLARACGRLGTLWRAPLLALLERDLVPDILLMDGYLSARKPVDRASARGCWKPSRPRRLPAVKPKCAWTSSTATTAPGLYTSARDLSLSAPNA